MGNFLEMHKLPELCQEKVNNSNRAVADKEFEAAIKKPYRQDEF